MWLCSSCGASTRESCSCHHKAAINTDREIWRERPGDYYADSIHVTEGGGIGINCGGSVVVLPLRVWHELAVRHAYEASALAGGNQASMEPAKTPSASEAP